MIGQADLVTLIEEKKAKGPRKGRVGADPGRALGDHPDKGGSIVVKNGRYGPYVSHDGINATLPTDMTPDAITLEQAVGLIDARAARGGGGKKPAVKATQQRWRGDPRQAAQHRAQSTGEGKGRTEAAGRCREKTRPQGQGRQMIRQQVNRK